MTQSRGKSQKEGQDDQGRMKELGGTPGLPSGFALCKRGGRAKGATITGGVQGGSAPPPFKIYGPQKAFKSPFQDLTPHPTHKTNRDPFKRLFPGVPINP